MTLYDMIEPYLKNKNSKNFKKGEIIYHQGDTPSSIFFVLEGMAGLFHITESGKETFLRIFSKGSIMGHRSYLANENYHATSMALEATKLIVVTKDECMKIFSDNTPFLTSMVQLLARDLGQIELRMSGLYDKSVTKRIIESLIFLKSRHPNHTWTRKDIAEYSGSTFETVTRVMTQLADEKMIEKNGRDFKIFNNQSLIEYSEQL